MVSILVFVELALDEKFRMDMDHLELQVSILVFVELALDDGLDTDGVILPKCFNPCFRGTCS